MNLESLEYPLFKTTWWEKRILRKVLDLFIRRDVHERYLCTAIFYSGMFGKSWLIRKIDKSLNAYTLDIHLVRYYKHCPQTLELVLTDSLELRVVWIKKLLEYKGN